MTLSDSSWFLGQPSKYGIPIRALDRTRKAGKHEFRHHHPCLSLMRATKVSISPALTAMERRCRETEQWNGVKVAQPSRQNLASISKSTLFRGPSIYWLPPLLSASSSEVLQHVFSASCFCIHAKSSNGQTPSQQFQDRLCLLTSQWVPNPHISNANVNFPNDRGSMEQGSS